MQNKEIDFPTTDWFRKALLAYVPRGVIGPVTEGQQHMLAELRIASVMFVNLMGLGKLELVVRKHSTI